MIREHDACDLVSDTPGKSKHRVEPGDIVHELGEEKSTFGIVVYVTNVAHDIQRRAGVMWSRYEPQQSDLVKDMRNQIRNEIDRDILQDLAHFAKKQEA